MTILNFRFLRVKSFVRLANVNRRYSSKICNDFFKLNLGENPNLPLEYQKCQKSLNEVRKYQMFMDCVVISFANQRVVNLLDSNKENFNDWWKSLESTFNSETVDQDTEANRLIFAIRKYNDAVVQLSQAFRFTPLYYDGYKIVKDPNPLSQDTVNLESLMSQLQARTVKNSLSFLNFVNLGECLKSFFQASNGKKLKVNYNTLTLFNTMWRKKKDIEINDSKLISFDIFDGSFSTILKNFNEKAGVMKAGKLFVGSRGRKLRNKRSLNEDYSLFLMQQPPSERFVDILPAFRGKTTLNIWRSILSTCFQDSDVKPRDLKPFLFPSLIDYPSADPALQNSIKELIPDVENTNWAYSDKGIKKILFAELREESIFVFLVLDNLIGSKDDFNSEYLISILKHNLMSLNKDDSEFNEELRFLYESRFNRDSVFLYLWCKYFQKVTHDVELWNQLKDPSCYFRCTYFQQVVNVLKLWNELEDQVPNSLRYRLDIIQKRYQKICFAISEWRSSKSASELKFTISDVCRWRGNILTKKPSNFDKIIEVQEEIRLKTGEEKTSKLEIEGSELTERFETEEVSRKGFSVDSFSYFVYSVKNLDMNHFNQSRSMILSTASFKKTSENFIGQKLNLIRNFNSENHVPENSASVKEKISDLQRSNLRKRSLFTMWEKPRVAFRRKLLKFLFTAFHLSCLQFLFREYPEYLNNNESPQSYTDKDIRIILNILSNFIKLNPSQVIFEDPAILFSDRFPHETSFEKVLYASLYQGKRKKKNEEKGDPFRRIRRIFKFLDNVDVRQMDVSGSNLLYTIYCLLSTKNAWDDECDKVMELVSNLKFKNLLSDTKNSTRKSTNGISPSFFRLQNPAYWCLCKNVKDDVPFSCFHERIDGKTVTVFVDFLEKNYTYSDDDSCKKQSAEMFWAFINDHTVSYNNDFLSKTFDKFTSLLSKTEDKISFPALIHNGSLKSRTTKSKFKISEEYVNGGLELLRTWFDQEGTIEGMRENLISFLKVKTISDESPLDKNEIFMIVLAFSYYAASYQTIQTSNQISPTMDLFSQQKNHTFLNNFSFDSTLGHYLKTPTMPLKKLRLVSDKRSHYLLQDVKRSNITDWYVFQEDALISNTDVLKVPFLIKNVEDAERNIADKLEIFPRKDVFSYDVEHIENASYTEHVEDPSYVESVSKTNEESEDAKEWEPLVQRDSKRSDQNDVSNSGVFHAAATEEILEEILHSQEAISKEINDTDREVTDSEPKVVSVEPKVINDEEDLRESPLIANETSKAHKDWKIESKETEEKIEFEKETVDRSVLFRNLLVSLALTFFFSHYLDTSTKSKPSKFTFRNLLLTFLLLIIVTAFWILWTFNFGCVVCGV